MGNRKTSKETENFSRKSGKGMKSKRIGTTLLARYMAIPLTLTLTCRSNNRKEFTPKMHFQ